LQPTNRDLFTITECLFADSNKLYSACLCW